MPGARPGKQRCVRHSGNMQDSFRFRMAWHPRWAFALLFVVSAGCGYNEVIERDEDVKAGWSEVQNQYKRRADLVPNLVKTVQGAANFERDTLQKVVEARASVGKVNVDASTIDDPQKLA